jgi:prepilin-type N-terminal cleavage/methylation domain-containing protein
MQRVIDAAGYTLVEVIIAMLISAIMVTAMFGVGLTSKQGTGKSDRHLIAAQAARQVTSQLRNYVTGCGCGMGGVWEIPAESCLVPSVPGACSLLLGPNTSNSGYQTWYFNAPTATPPIIDSQGPVYALAPGTHTITGLLPSLFAGAPYNAVVDYYVSFTPGLMTLSTSTPRVDVSVIWTEP